MTEAERAHDADARGTPADSPSRHLRWPIVALCGLVLIAAVWSVAGSHFLEPDLSTNLDEQAYLHQAALLARGHLAVSVPSELLARNVQPWFAGSPPITKASSSSTTLVWPAVLTVTTFVSAPRSAPCLRDRASSSWARTRFAGGRAALPGEGCGRGSASVALSPLALIQSTTLLSYVLFGGLWTLAAAALLRGISDHATPAPEHGSGRALGALAVSCGPALRRAGRAGAVRGVGDLDRAPRPSCLGPHGGLDAGGGGPDPRAASRVQHVRDRRSVARLLHSLSLALSFDRAWVRRPEGSCRRASPKWRSAPGRASTPSR